MSKRIVGLDHLRALAIVLVFLCHYRLFPHPDWLDTVGSFGWTGVDLFFVLSGYLIAGQIFRDHQAGRFSIKVFYIQRAFRILPAFLVVLSLYFLLPSFREWESLAPLWKFLTFTQNLGLDLRYQRTFSHAWSLCIEEQFYLLLPATFLILTRTGFAKRGWLIVLFLLLISPLLRLVSWYAVIEPAAGSNIFGMTWHKWIYYPTHTRLDGLMTGVGIATLEAFGRRSRGLISFRWVPLIGAVLLVAAYLICAQQMTFDATVLGFLLVALGYGTFVMACTRAGSWINRYPSKITGMIARLSYSIYLCHKMTIHLVQQWAGVDPEGTMMFVWSVLGTAVFAGVLHFGVERTFLRWRDRFVSFTTDHSVDIHPVAL